MDIERVLFHTKELMELRGENGDYFQTKINDVDLQRFMDDLISIELQHHTLFFAISKDSFKEFWASIRNLSLEEMEATYKNRKFILILGEYPPSITLQALQQKDVVFNTSNGFIQLFLTKELMYNPNKHFLVPKHEKMSEEEVKQLMDELKLKTRTQLPFIQKTDIIARWLGLKQGDVIRITRYSETSGEYMYYRTCI